MISSILTIIVSFFLLAGYILAAGAVLWVIGIAWVACTDGRASYRRVCKSGVWICAKADGFFNGSRNCKGDL